MKRTASHINSGLALYGLLLCGVATVRHFLEWRRV